MLYPVLHRLERLGYVQTKWRRSATGRRRKYYRITTQGRAQLAALRQQWQLVDTALRGTWQTFSEEAAATLTPLLEEN